MLRCLGRLQEVCSTGNDVLLFTASGSGAFESAVVNLLSPGDRVLVVSAGEFGERWAELAGRTAPTWSRSATSGARRRAEDLRAQLEETGAETVFLVHSETSTGVVADVEALGAGRARSGRAHRRRRGVEPRGSAARD